MSDLAVAQEYTLVDAGDVEVGMVVRRPGDGAWLAVEEIGRTYWLRWVKLRGDGPTITAPPYALVEAKLEAFEF